MNRAKLVELAGYNVFFWVCFWLFAYWTFPYERVSAYLVDKVAESGTGYTIEIGDLSPYWFTGVELEDVTVHKQPAAQLDLPGPGAEAGNDGSFKIKEARARIGIFAFLLSDTSVSFDAELEQGEVDGSYEESGDEKHLDATLSGIDLSKVSVLESLISLPTRGMVEGEFDLTLGKEPTKSSGTVKLMIKGLILGDGKAKLKIGGMGGLTIDPIEAGDVTLELDVKEGVGVVKNLGADGKDLELKGSGEVRFADPLSRSRIDMLVRIKITDAYKNKSDRTKAMFSLLDGSGAPALRTAKTPDGALQYKLAGTISTARALPAGRARSAGGAGRFGARKTSGDVPPVELPGSQAADEEE